MATKLSNPQGKTINIAIVPAMELQFGFETGAGLYTHDGDNLVISFEDGGRIVLTDFYAQAPEELPEFLVEGDTKISSEQFLAQFNDESLLPAAGPAATADTSNAGSGMNSYADDAGNLVTGVSRLAGLGNSQWSRSTTENTGAEQNGVATTAAAAGQINPSNPTSPSAPTDPSNPTDPTNPVDPTDPEPNSPKPDAGFPADVRFVMFRDPSADPDSAWEMTGLVKGASSFANGKQAIQTEYGTAIIDANGNVTYILDAEHAGEHKPPLVDYIKYTGADGKEHSVQVVVTTDPKFDDAAKEPGNYNDIEGGILYEVQDGGQAIGNYDTSSSDKDSAKLDGSDFLSYNYLDGGTVNAGLGDDEITIHGGMGNNSTIDAGLGDDKITIAQGMANNSTVDAGTGSNTVTVGGSMSSNSTISAMGDDSAGDKNTIVVKGGMVASTGELNLIESNAGTIDLNEAMIAVDGGTNTINGGSSDVKVDGTSYGMAAMYGGASNSITTTNDVTITTAGIGLGAFDGGKNTIDAKGDVVITAQNSSADSAVGMWGAGGKNEVSGKNVSVTASSVDGSVWGLSNTNKIVATGDVNIKATTINGSEASAISGDANITAANVNLVASAATKATGIWTQGLDSTINTGNLKVEATAANEATGMYANAYNNGAAPTGTNTVNATGTVDIKATANNGNAYGIKAENYGANVINAKDVNITTSADIAYGLMSNTNGTNLINATGNVKIVANSGNVALGLSAESGGKNTIIAGGNVDITAKSYGVYADGVGSSNTINAANVNMINVTGRGMHASNSASNDINTTGNTTITGGSAAAGLHAESNGKNTITAGGDVNVAGGTIGMKALGGSDSINKIDARSTVTVSAADAKGSGMSADTGGTNIINAGVAANVSGSQYGMYAASAGKNIIGNTDAQGNVIAGMTGNVSVKGSIGISANNADSQNIINTAGTVDVTSKDYAMQATTAGKNIISAGGETNITGGNYGMYAATAGKNIIANTDAQGNVIAGMTGAVNVRGGTYGLTASGANSENIINTTGDVKVTSATTGLSATSGASNSITAGDVDLAVNSGSNRATGLLASSAGSKNTVNAAGDVDIVASALGSSSLVYGMNASAGGTNTVNAEGTVDITSTATKGKAYGMTATGVNSVNTIDAADVSINATGGTNSYAMYADGSGGKNIITSTGSVDINVSSGTAQSMGMYASGLGSSNTVSATGSVDIDVTATGAKGFAFGMNALSGGINTINAGSVDIDATATGASGIAYGMKAETAWSNVGKNTINTSGDVSITAEASNPANSFAMHTSGAGATNTINAADASHGVSITLTASTAMFTVGGGSNIIIGSSHSDTVTINGNITDTGNIINTGAGDDKLVLNGKIDSSFVFSAGEGTDTLVLTAATQIEFDSYYKDWLTNFFKGDQAKELEQISLNGTNPEDVKWLTDLVNTHNNNNSDNPILFVDSEGYVLGAEQPAGDEGDHSAVAAPTAFGFAPTSFKLSGSDVAEDNGFLNLQSTQSTDSLATAPVAVVAQAVEPVEAQATTTHDLQSAVAHELGLTAPETSPVAHELVAVAHEAVAVAHELVAPHEAVAVEDNASVVSAHHNDYSEISGMLVPHSDGTHSGFADSISFEYVAHVTGSDGTSLLDSVHGHVLEGADSGMIAINSAGNDSVSGSTGNDVFSWHADANNVLNADGQGTNVGTIVDFSISGVLEGTFVDGQNGNDKIDLSALFNEGMQHLNVKSDGLGNAVIEVSASADAPVAQEIVLQDVYSNHSVSSGQEESFNQMILQHIITNNG